MFVFMILSWYKYQVIRGDGSTKVDAIVSDNRITKEIVDKGEGVKNCLKMG